MNSILSLSLKTLCFYQFYCPKVPSNYKLIVCRRGNEDIIYRIRILVNSLRQFGFDPIVFFKSILVLPKYIKQFVYFKVLSKSLKIRLAPALQDYRASAGSSDGHYFWQDLICAKWIYKREPKNHFDVGSRIDGFIAHLLTFREVTLLDIRPSRLDVEGLRVVVGDAQQSLKSFQNKFESVSSLHSIEHFGLGRYGDSLDVEGHAKGLINIAECVNLGGNLYVSFPIGESSIEFNSQRIISPLWPIELLKDFELKEFVLIPWKGNPIFGLNPMDVNCQITGQAGMYNFERVR